MGFVELLLIAVGLSMDAFAVSICKGLSVQKVKPKHAACVALYFGGFQALMPLAGYLLVSTFSGYIQRFDHWIAFILLALIGANMIREAFSKEEESMSGSFSVKTMLLLAVATSIDALATGVTFQLTGTNIWMAISLVGCTTFLFSFLGVKVGSTFGAKYQSKAELIGGVILVLMGVKILLEHLLGG